MPTSSMISVLPYPQINIKRNQLWLTLTASVKERLKKSYKVKASQNNTREKIVQEVKQLHLSSRL